MQVKPVLDRRAFSSPKEVEENIREYFKENLPRYQVMEIRKKSYHPDDDFLYMIASKKDDGAYTV